MVSMSLDWWWPVSSSYYFLLRPSHTCLIAAVWVVLASLAVLLYQYYHNHHGNKHESGPLTTSSSRRLPPGSRGLPLLGETLRLIGAYKTADPEPFIDERVARHGSRVFTTHLFGETTVFSADPDVNRTVVQGEGRTFESSYPSSVATLLGPHSLVLTKGAAHRRLHSLVLGAFANKGTLREALLPDVDAMVRRSLDGWWKWEEKGEGVTGGEDQSGKVLRLMDQAKKITFELAVKQLMSEEPGEWTEGLRRHYLAVIDGFFSLPISFLPFSTYRRALKARAKVAEQIRAVVRRRKHEMSMMMMSEEEGQWSGKAGATTAAATASSGNKVRVGEGRCRDVLDALLVMGEEENNNSSHDSEDGDSRKKKKTESELEEEVVDFLLALLIAGYETTPTIMTVLVKFITECPRALAMLKEEHEAIRSRKKDDLEPLDWSDCKTSMPFTQCVINESLRLANIISGVFRRATTDVNIKGGYTIPKGTKVFASFRGVHLAEEFHHDARTFNPWRWTQQEQTVVVDQQQQHTVKQQQQQAAPVFTPFGGGPRMCPGYELARVEISVFLHYFVTAYTWEPAGEDTLVHFPTARLLNSYPVRLLQRHRALV